MERNTGLDDPMSLDVTIQQAAGLLNAPSGEALPEIVEKLMENSKRTRLIFL